MKNTNFRKLLFAGLLSTTFIACKKDDMPASPNDMYHVKSDSEPLRRRGNTNNSTNYSETFTLLSFSGTKLQGDNTYSAYLKIDWSVVGEKDVSTYEIEQSPNGKDNWGSSPHYQKITISNTTDSLKKYTQTSGFGLGGSYGKKITKSDYFRLKTTLTNNSIQYSSVTSISYSIPNVTWP